MDIPVLHLKLEQTVSSTKDEQLTLLQKQHLPLKLDGFFVKKPSFSEREANHTIFPNMEKNSGEKRQGSSFDGQYIILAYIIYLGNLL